MTGSSSYLSDSGKHWKIGADAESGFNFLGLDSEGTGREQVNLMWRPARIEVDDPEGNVLTDDWVVFTGAYYDDELIGKAGLTKAPDSLKSSGRLLERKFARASSGRLDLAPLIGGTLPKAGAYVYIPFSLEKEQEITFGFGADYWLQAWVDGAELCSTFPGGNRTYPPTSSDFVQTVKLGKGSHLLVIRFISGQASSLLCVSAKIKLWTTAWEIRDDRWICTMRKTGDGSQVIWEISAAGDDLSWRVNYEGKGAVNNVRLVLPFNPMITPTVLFPARLGDGGVGRGPWLMVAPDFGHLRIEEEKNGSWQAIIAGQRGSGCMQPYAQVVPPTERGEISKAHVGKLGYYPQKLDIVFCLNSPLRAGGRAGLRLSPVELNKPAGIDAATWKRIRRPYLNQWQPCSNWTPRKAEPMMLGNNTLSDVAFCCTAFYADPMLFWHEMVPGISVLPLLRHTVDHALRYHVGLDGHVNALWSLADLHLYPNPMFIIAARDYWMLSQDKAWLNANIHVLHRIGEFLARRDLDHDGLVESFNGGNAWSLREPDHADIWFEFMNFGWKNAWTNALTYRAWNCLAEMLKAAGHPGGADYYLALAGKLRKAFTEKLLSKEHGWFASWISGDGEIHDYCHTFVNGMAVAYGIVPPAEGRAILERVVRKSHEIGFKEWRFGIPSNLLPARKGDMIRPAITMDGVPEKSSWPDDLTEEKAFGYVHPNGLIHPVMVWPYLLGLQTAGMDEEAERILQAMIKTAEEGLFQNGITNIGGSGPEYIRFDGRTAGYEGYLPEVWNFLMAAFTSHPDMRKKLLGKEEIGSEKP